MNLIIFSAYVLWAAIIWRFRGGAFTTLTGINPGTQGARALCGLALGVPSGGMITPWWHAALVAPAILIGLMICGWEEFQMMGTGGALETEKPNYWPRWLPGALGLKIGTMPYDMVGMAEEGLLCMFPCMLALIFWYDLRVLWLAAAGFCFSFAYALARVLPMPTIPRFASGQAWGEVFTGALVGAALMLVLKGP